MSVSPCRRSDRPIPHRPSRPPRKGTAKARPQKNPHPRPLDAAARARAETAAWVAYRVAWRFARRHARDVPVDELIAEALFALTYAASQYRESRGVPFEGYAHMVIRHWLMQTVLRCGGAGGRVDCPRS